MTDISTKISFLGASMHPWTMADTVKEIESRLDKDVFTQTLLDALAKRGMTWNN